MQLGHLGRAPAPLARHDLIGFAAQGPHQDGGQHPFFLHRLGQVGQCFFAEKFARLEFAGAQKGDRQSARALGHLAARRSGFVSDQGGQATAKAAAWFFLGCHAATRIFSRWINSPASLM